MAPRIADKLHAARTLIRAGVAAPSRPDRLARALIGLHRYGPTLAAGYVAAAARYPSEPAIIDELGLLTFEQVHRRTNALAHGFARHGIRAGSGVAIMCRNHRGFVEASVACSKLGAHSLYLNTSFAAPQITAVVEREDPVAVVYDQEFAGLVDDPSAERLAFVAWQDDPRTTQHSSLEDLIVAGAESNLTPPSAPGRTVILTSGTTGTPKGANRATPRSLDPAAALLSRIPLHAREPTMIAAPLFHAWGFAHLFLGTALASTLVLRRRFEPEATLEAIAENQATALIVVPVMLQRILELPEARIRSHDLRSLRVIAASGSVLPGPLAARVMDTFGDKLYNLYGSTEVAWATIATPEDLRAAPGTAGRPPRGTVVKLLDEQCQEVPAGHTGRIFVGNELLFEGYTGGADKVRFGSLMSTGDVGHFDAGGRLFIDGRDDDMIVSGGENVFPQEVEDLIAHLPGVREVAVVGVPDDEFGQRLAAFVALDNGAEITEQDLKDHVKSNLAAYKVPRSVTFVDELPRNATGKVLGRELKTRV
jgi:fatty-acyl-CoA synthase